MNKRNIYWMLSWWYIFDIADRKAHDLAYNIIWECVTSQANINYLKPIENELHFDRLQYEVINKTNSTILIAIKYEDNFLATFMFIKKQ